MLRAVGASSWLSSRAEKTATKRLVRKLLTIPGCLLGSVPSGLHEYWKRLEPFREINARREERRLDAVIENSRECYDSCAENRILRWHADGSSFWKPGGCTTKRNLSDLRGPRSRASPIICRRLYVLFPHGKWSRVQTGVNSSV
jgi:hypothetical protein